jgi:acetylornithine deacetylase
LNPTKLIKEKVEQYVKEVDVSKLPSAVYSRFAIPEENAIGKLELKWVGDASRGVACDLESPGYYAICEAIQNVRGNGQ